MTTKKYKRTKKSKKSSHKTRKQKGSGPYKKLGGPRPPPQSAAHKRHRQFNTQTPEVIARKAALAEEQKILRSKEQAAAAADAQAKAAAQAAPQKPTSSADLAALLKNPIPSNYGHMEVAE